MFLLQKNFCIRSATLDDATFLYQQRKEKKKGEQISLPQLIMQIKENKVRMSQLLILEKSNDRIGELSYFLTRSLARVHLLLYKNSSNDGKFESDVLSTLINFLLNDKQIQEIYQIKRIVSNINVMDFNTQRIYERSGFIKKDIQYGMFKDQSGFEGDILVYEYCQNQLNLSSYNTLLFDVDNTLLDFTKAERKSLEKALRDIQIEPNESLLQLYHKINITYWEKVERNEMSREECLIRRFVDFFDQIHFSYDAYKMEEIYRAYLNESAYVVKNARFVLNELKKTHDLYIITNGVKKTQNHRLRKAKMDSFFIKKFISEEIGANKPSSVFMKAVEEQIPSFDRQRTLIIGDSLTSDILLGQNHQIKTCWFNKEKITNQSNIHPDYVIYDLKELLTHKK